MLAFLISLLLLLTALLVSLSSWVKHSNFMPKPCPATRTLWLLAPSIVRPRCHLKVLISTWTPRFSLYNLEITLGWVALTRSAYIDAMIRGPQTSSQGQHPTLDLTRKLERQEQHLQAPALRTEMLGSIPCIYTKAGRPCHTIRHYYRVLNFSLFDSVPFHSEIPTCVSFIYRRLPGFACEGASRILHMQPWRDSCLGQLKGEKMGGDGKRRKEGKRREGCWRDLGKEVGR